MKFEIGGRGTRRKIWRIHQSKWRRSNCYGGEAVKQTGLSVKLTNNQRSFWVIGTRNDCSQRVIIFQLRDPVVMNLPSTTRRKRQARVTGNLFHETHWNKKMWQWIDFFLPFLPNDKKKTLGLCSDGRRQIFDWFKIPAFRCSVHTELTLPQESPDP